MDELYVYDTILWPHQEAVQILLDHDQFTMEEEEENNQRVFLDVLITLMENGLKTFIYHNPIFIEQGIIQYPQHCKNHKWRPRCIRTRMISMTLKDNNYPSNISSLFLWDKEENTKIASLSTLCQGLIGKDLENLWSR